MNKPVRAKDFKGRKVKRTPSVPDPIWSWPLPERPKSYGRRNVRGDGHYEEGYFFYTESPSGDVTSERRCLHPDYHSYGPMLLPQPIKGESNENPVPDWLKRWPLYNQHKI